MTCLVIRSTGSGLFAFLEPGLRCFASFLSSTAPEVPCVSQITRGHIGTHGGPHPAPFAEAAAIRVLSLWVIAAVVSAGPFCPDRWASQGL
jgi:hypothetical protein